MATKILDLTKPAIFSVENFGGLEKIADIDEKTQTIKTVLMRLSAVSRNRTFYDGDDFVKALKTNDYINEQIEQGVWFGELEHPPRNCTQERFFEISTDNTSHRILDYKVEGDLIKGTVQFVAPKGWIPWDWITKNANIAFSVRVYTPHFVEKTDERGMKYIAKHGHMVPITFDCVRMPGYRIARVADPDVYKKEIHGKLGTENSPYYVMSEEEAIRRFEFENMYWKRSMSNEEFKHMLSKESAMRILEDIYEFDSKNTNITYGTEGYVNIELPNNRGKLSVRTNTYNMLKVHHAKNKMMKK